MRNIDFSKHYDVSNLMKLVNLCMNYIMVALLATIAFPAFSASGVYLTFEMGDSFSSAEIDNFHSNSSICSNPPPKTCTVDSTDTSKKIGIGYGFTDNLSLEVASIQLGTIADYYFPNAEESKYLYANQVSEGVEALGVLKLNNILVDNLNVNLKLGLFRWNSKASTELISPSGRVNTESNDRGESIVKGIEIEYLLTANISILLATTLYSDLGKSTFMVDDNLNTSTIKSDVRVDSIGLRVGF